MIAENTTTIKHEQNLLGYDDVCRIEQDIKNTEYCRFICIDLGRVRETSTAALAKLVGVRREVRMAGGDIRINGLAGQAEKLYEVYRMERILPRVKKSV